MIEATPITSVIRKIRRFSDNSSMQRGLNEHAASRAAKGMAYGMAGAYPGAILLILAAGLTSGSDPVWTENSLHDLLVGSLTGVIFLGWWILPVGAALEVHFFPRLSTSRRTRTAIAGVLMGAALGLLTAVFFALISDAPTHTIRTSFVFLPLYCAAWCGGYSALKANRP